MKKVTVIFVVIALISTVLISCGRNNNNSNENTNSTERQKTLTPKEEALKSLEKDGIIIPDMLKSFEITRGSGKIKFKSENLDSVTVVNIYNWLRKQVKDLQNKGWEQWKPISYNIFDNKDADGFFYSISDEFKSKNENIALKIKPKNITKAVMFNFYYTYPIQKSGNEVSLTIRRESSDL